MSKFGHTSHMGYRDYVSRLLQAKQSYYLSGGLEDSEMIGIEIDVLMNPVDYKVSNSIATKEAVYSLDKEENDTLWVTLGLVTIVVRWGTSCLTVPGRCQECLKSKEWTTPMKRKIWWEQ